ncbi:hypothetical protein RD792_014852 [Penstemon davidsonii]|uniref:SGNH hydrolase-type esterase domain-containing protein n=1 Tax=Penstemon davidsonii TaxID=160366 RepID=A0ABR0CQF5_9LAMI|nr:hypothetical protein RD792_014852 [Penstemon davidsonii]
MRPQIVFFGDAITQQSFASGGWGAAIADSYSRKADVVLRGYSGYNTRWALFLLNRLFPLGSGTPPVAVTIFFGANDAALIGGTGERQHVPIEEYKDNLRKIVQHIKNNSPDTLIVLITPPPSDLQGRREHARSLYGDKASTVPDRTNEESGLYAEQCVSLGQRTCDGLHLTPQGNAVVSEAVDKVFDEAGLSALPYDFPPHADIDAENPEKAFVQQCAAI